MPQCSSDLMFQRLKEVCPLQSRVFVRFSNTAAIILPAEPASVAAASKHDSAVGQTLSRPVWSACLLSFHGTIVRPSRCLPSDLVNPWWWEGLQMQKHGQLARLMHGAWPFCSEIFYYHHHHHHHHHKAVDGLYSCGKVPKRETAFPLCRATDSLWNRKMVSLLSSVMAVVRLAISCTSSMTCWLHDSAVCYYYFFTLGKYNPERV